MAIVGPGYLNLNYLPNASDIFYHEKLIYFLPTGFHPIELNSIIEFPSYCFDKSIALPSIIWDMCNLYFECDKAAEECLDIIEPLREKFVKIIATIYPRDWSAIDDSRKLLVKYPLLYENFKKTVFDLQFAARELLSHVLYEIFILEGYNGAIKYLRANSKNPEDLLLLIAAVLINRLKIFTKYNSTLLLYDCSWFPVISQLAKLDDSGGAKDTNVDDSDSLNVEHFRFKLFEAILMPIFGRCETKTKSHTVEQIATKKRKEIDVLKERCKVIATEVVLLPTCDIKLKQAKLSDMITKEILKPLSDVIEKPLKDIKSLLSNFILDSTVIGGVLSLLQNSDVNVMSTAVAAGAISTVVKYILHEESQKQVK
jgi:hypothetical protein